MVCQLQFEEQTVLHRRRASNPSIWGNKQTIHGLLIFQEPQRPSRRAIHACLVEVYCIKIQGLLSFMYF